MRAIGRLLLVTAFAAAALGSSRAALAAEVELELDAGLTWTGSPVGLRVKVINPTENFSSPEIPTVTGLDIRGPAGKMRSSERGRGASRDVLTLNYQVTPEPGRKGKFTIGPVTVRTASGAVLKSKSTELLVYDPPEVGVLLEARTTPAGGPVGATFRVVYTIYYYGDTPDSDSLFSRGKSLGLTRLELPVHSLSNAKVVPVAVLDGIEAHEVQLTKELKVVLQQGAAEKDGKGYLTYVLGFDVTPFTPGPIELGGARSSMQLLTGGMKIGRDVFGRRVQVPDDKEFSAQSPSTIYEVRQLPAEGRPQGFNGAVGKYQVAVTASPTEVDEGAPITLEIRVTGQGLLEELKPAIWSEVDSLARDFQVSTDVDSGKVENNAKVFRQVIRPRSEKVTAIPPVPFPYFDFSVNRYQVVQSPAIPIKVRQAKKVSIEAAVPSPQATQVTAARTPSQVPGIVEVGGVGANFESPGVPRPALDPRDEVLSAPFCASVVVPPLAFAGLAAGLRLRRRDPALRRKAQALSRALLVLADATDPQVIASACEGYFRDRLGLPPGEVTQGDVASALERSRLPVATRLSAAGLIERAHAARFGAGGSDAALAEEAARVLKEVEGCLRG